jgi:hypothetical protein
MKQNLGLLDTDYEIKAIIDFVSLHWEGFEQNEFKDILMFAWNAGLQYGKDNFNRYDLTEFISEWLEERKQVKTWLSYSSLEEDEIGLVASYDSIYKSIVGIMLYASKLDTYIMKDWNYEKITSQITSKIKNEYNNVDKIKPKGWKELSDGYSDFDGMKEYVNPQGENAFKGVNSSGVSSGGFDLRISLPQVMYGEKCQGRSVLLELIGAIMAHAMFVQTNNNTQKILEDLIILKTEFNKEEFYSKIQNFKLSEMTNNRYLKCVFQISELDNINMTEEEFRLQIAKHVRNNKKANLATLTEEESKQYADKQIEKMIDEFNNISPEQKQKNKLIEQTRSDKVEKIIKLLFNDTSNKFKNKP